MKQFEFAFSANRGLFSLVFGGNTREKRPLLAGKNSLKRHSLSFYRKVWCVIWETRYKKCITTKLLIYEFFDQELQIHRLPR